MITGIAGQDGSYLAERLLDDGYEVAGVVRPGVSLPATNLAAVQDDVELVDADLRDPDVVAELLTKLQPDELYHLASSSFVPASWQDPVETARFGAVTTSALFETARLLPRPPRVFLATSAEVFGEPLETPQSERTPIAPITPYGVAKAYALQLARAFRRRYGQFIACGILYNHESPRRPREFVTRKVARAAVEIANGQRSELVLGNLESRRDWGDARDVVRAMWLSLHVDDPDDYVIATGRARTVRELVACAFGHLGLEWERHVRRDESLMRDEATVLVGDPSRARERLGWEPQVSFEELVYSMVDAELRAVDATTR